MTPGSGIATDSIGNPGAAIAVDGTLTAVVEPEAQEAGIEAPASSATTGRTSRAGFVFMQVPDPQQNVSSDGE
jgi:3-methyladenine DNA glycosylase Mpg